MTGYTTGAGNRLTASPNAIYTYENEGNLESKTDTTNDHVTTYVYDHRNRLIGVTEKDDTDAVVMQTTYTYDALDRRLSLVDGVSCVARTLLATNGSAASPGLRLALRSGPAMLRTIGAGANGPKGKRPNRRIDGTRREREG